MKANFALLAGLANTVLASPLAVRDAASDLAALTSTVKVHTARINQTLATLSTVSTTSSVNSTGNANITAEFSLIAQALNTTSDGVTTCNATCMLSTYSDLGDLTAEIAYTAKGCVAKNAVDVTSSSSVLVKVVKGLTAATDNLEDTVGTIAGIVVQNLNAALGPEIGSVLALFITTF
ncbi:hypothetical protein N0V93_005902 [Gnomoniopsis smithogilvyi]|uniref:Uncharacterized protein n=1 Tax=Gnomoniopsis smithogilvyi TaxID=1191159 RepID=A0A9W8YXH6_9PEZI|nr:hypothetical protein N0V93_005902 [Gnomoniopsis smithogilvyi]